MSIPVDAPPPSPELLATLRRNLPYLEDGAELDQQAPLENYGLDSLGVVTLMLELEDALGVTFPEEAMTRETFESASSIWQVVVSLGAS